jgi:hypothetical protein
VFGKIADEGRDGAKPATKAVVPVPPAKRG